MSVLRFLFLSALILGPSVRANEPAVKAGPRFSLPAAGETVSLDQIRLICQHFDLPQLWTKIERDPPPFLSKATASRDGFANGKESAFIPLPFSTI